MKNGDEINNPASVLELTMRPLGDNTYNVDALVDLIYQDAVDHDRSCLVEADNEEIEVPGTTLSEGRVEGGYYVCSFSDSQERPMDQLDVKAKVYVTNILPLSPEATTPPYVEGES